MAATSRGALVASSRYGFEREWKMKGKAISSIQCCVKNRKWNTKRGRNASLLAPRARVQQSDAIACLVSDNCFRCVVCATRNVKKQRGSGPKRHCYTQQHGHKLSDVHLDQDASHGSKADMFLVRTDGFTCTREVVKDNRFTFAHPSTQQNLLLWSSRPKTVLVLKKIGDTLLPKLIQLLNFLQTEGMTIVLEPDVRKRIEELYDYGESSIRKEDLGLEGIPHSKDSDLEIDVSLLQTFDPTDADVRLIDVIDLVVCLGGDGVILHASSLFPTAVPPVICFNLGSMGFLANHTFKDFREDMKAVIEGDRAMGGVYITLRMRLKCRILRRGKPLPGKRFDVLNEVVVDRGSDAFLAKVECYERDRLITLVQADGVMISTPTGSTAYSVAAGGSMIHPSVPAILFTPICPHSLSFRPVVLPDSAELELRVPDDARSSAWVCFDGKNRQQLIHGDAVQVQMSRYPVPTVNKMDQTHDWFGSLNRCLSWNDRSLQKDKDW